MPVKRFTPPTVEQVKAYCLERQNRVNAEQFVDHYTSNGWRVGGKSPMKDWKAAVRNWERNSYNSGQTRKQTDFNTFEQRRYDYDALKNKLLRR